MHNPAYSPFGESTEDRERLALEKRWYEGRLLTHVDKLLIFTEAHRVEILSTAKGKTDPQSLLEATKAVIQSRGSVHMPSELQDQMQEMNREVWYQGEKGQQDTHRIKREWTDRHAANWRRWRISEYLFVADHCAELISAKLSKVNKARDL